MKSYWIDDISKSELKFYNTFNIKPLIYCNGPCRATSLKIGGVGGCSVCKEPHVLRKYPNLEIDGRLDKIEEIVIEQIDGVGYNKTHGICISSEGMKDRSNWECFSCNRTDDNDEPDWYAQESTKKDALLELAIEVYGFWKKDIFCTMLEDIYNAIEKPNKKDN